MISCNKILTLNSQLNACYNIVMSPKIFSFLKKNIYYIIGLILIIAGGVYYYENRGNNTGEFVKLTKGSLINEVSVAGKVISSKDVSLSFETAGTVNAVNKDVGQRVVVGDVIASLDSSSPQANLEKAQADLAGEQAKLDQLQNGDNQATEVTTAKRKLVDAILDGFTSSDDAIRNKTDQFFEDADTGNPKILFAFNDYDLKEKINNQRIVIEETLEKWETLNSKITADNVTVSNADTVRGYMTILKAFLNDVSRAVNSFEPNNTLSQTTIDKYKNDVALARTNINNALSAITSTQEGIRSTSSGKPVQEAKVRSAQSSVDALKTQIAKTYMRAPFSGIVSIQDAKVGEAISPSMSLVSLISESYEIEAYIPELNISGVDVKDKARVNLDAFGATSEFGATVIKIDPAETVKDGVATYKVRLAFESADARIRPGMTANIKIETGKKDGISIIPLRAVYDKNNVKFVQIKTKDDPIEKEIKIGEKDSRGNVEVLSGLNTDDQVLLNPTI
jgi:multidrug efflux pump subunit AcrA (membrane-fusion protein)